MRRATIPFLPVSWASFGIAVSALGCGQGFSAMADGGKSEASSKDVARDDVVEAGPVDSSNPVDAAHEAAVACGGANFMTDSKNCGGCEHSCGAGKCMNGFCAITAIATDLVNPNSIAVDGLGDLFFSSLGSCMAGTTMDMPGPCTGGKVQRSTVQVLDMDLVSVANANGFPGIPVTTDGKSVYWGLSQTPFTVKSLAVSGKGTPAIITPPVAATSWVALAVDDTYLYAGESGGTIYYTPTSGTMSWVPITNSAVLGALTASHLGGIHYVFWANLTDSAGDTTSGSVMGAVVSGSTGTAASWKSISLDAPSSVAVSLYGVDWVDLGASDLEQEPVATGKITTIVTADLPMPPAHVAADDNGSVYWTVHDIAKPGSGQVMVLYRGATTPIVLASDQNNPTSLALGVSQVYWVNAGTFNGKDGSVNSTSR
jgi:hypothetical protein